MSIDLSWAQLDSSLADSLIEILNRSLSNAPRPSFIGPVTVTSFDFGTISPDAELVDLRDIYRDFLEDDEDEDDREREGSGGGPSGSRRHSMEVKSQNQLSLQQGQGSAPGDEDEDFEWVSRRTAGRAERAGYGYDSASLRNSFSHGMSGGAPLPPWGPGMGMNMNASMPSLSTDRALWPGMAGYPTPSPATPFSPFAAGMYTPSMGAGLGVGSVGLHEVHSIQPSRSQSFSSHHSQQPLPPTAPSQIPSLPLDSPVDPNHPQQPQENPQPNVQVHLRVHWASDLRLTLQTSLLINYPSPMFMSLPIKLSITGLVFDGELAVAYEGQRKRVHVCILDDLDPYGPAASSDRPKREMDTTGMGIGTPPEEHDHDDHSSPSNSITLPGGPGSRGGGDSSPGNPRSGKPLPVGLRLLPSIFIDTEIGQTDKHVLKNVTRVERFIQDVIRKTIEEELVFPNFHTIVLPGAEGESNQS